MIPGNERIDVTVTIEAGKGLPVLHVIPGTTAASIGTIGLLPGASFSLTAMGASDVVSVPPAMPTIVIVLNAACQRSGLNRMPVRMATVGRSRPIQ